MSDRDDFRQAAAKVLDRDEVEGVLSSELRQSREAEYERARASRDTERDFFMGAEEAVKYGIADKVLVSRENT